MYAFRQTRLRAAAAYVGGFFFPSNDRKVPVMARAAIIRRKRLTALASTVLAVGLASACTGVLGDTGGDAASPAAASEPTAGPDLDWGECSEDEVFPPVPGEGAEGPTEADIPEDLRCAEVEVPVDHDAPGGRTTALQVAKLPHTGDGETMGAVLHVAGGPGAPGIPALHEHRETLADLRENFAVVAWNPRGTMGETAELLPHEVCGELGPEFVGAQTQEEFDEVVAEHAAVMDECRDHDPELFDSMDTLQHVGDMEAIREGLGEEQLDLHAHSHGGVRAAAYAELHPEQLSSVFLDSIVNHVSDYESLTTARLDQLESQFEEFGQWCAESEECALQGENVEERWQTLLAQANEEPLPAGEESFDHAQLAHFGSTLAKNEEMWEPFAAAVSATLEDGDATPFLEINGGRLPHAPNVVAADVCGDWAPYDDFDGYQQFNESAVEHSANFGHGQALQYLKCAAWPDEGVNPPGPIDTEELPPFLLAASELEYASSAPVADEVPGSATVTVEGTGHGLYFGESNSCLIEHVNRYFADGTLPEEGAYCESD